MIADAFDDTELTATVFSPVCSFCAHIKLVGGKWACDAFPAPAGLPFETADGGIPLEIWEGDVDHTEPYPGDNGIQFEPRPKAG